MLYRTQTCIHENGSMSLYHLHWMLPQQSLCRECCLCAVTWPPSLSTLHTHRVVVHFFLFISPILFSWFMWKMWTQWEEEILLRLCLKSALQFTHTRWNVNNLTSSVMICCIALRVLSCFVNGNRRSMWYHYVFKPLETGLSRYLRANICHC